MLVALHCLAGEPIFDLTVTEPDGVVLHCEGRDDLELVTPEARCLVSVKAQPGSLALITKEYSRLSERSFLDDSRRRSVALVLMGPQPSEVVSLATQIQQVKSLVVHRNAAEIEEIYTGFHNRWPKIDRRALDDFCLVLQWPHIYSREYLAIAAQLLRKVAPLTDYTDNRVNFILSELGNRFAQARHARGPVSLTEFKDTIFSFAMPLELITLAHAYVRTKYGYLPHPGIQSLLKREAKDVKIATNNALRRYRKSTRKHRFAAISLGPVNCIACGGPLMANLYGWFTHGIACTRCGFSPYISLFYACLCGRPIPLVTQPPLDPVDIMVSLQHAANIVRCEHCGQGPKLERLQTRVFQLNIPWPPEGFSDKNLIQARKDFGWNRARFRDGTADPTEVLLREALTDRIERRFTSDRTDL